MSNRASANVMTREALVEKFLSRVEMPSTPDECWIWKPSKTPRTYGVFYDSIERRYTTAYRFAYELVVGAVPEGLVLDHKCCVPACVNPQHLEPVTVSENLRRSHAQRRAMRQETTTKQPPVTLATVDVPPQFAWLNAKVSWSVYDVAQAYEGATGATVSHDTVTRWFKRLTDGGAENYGGTIGWRAQRDALVVFFRNGRHLRRADDATNEQAG